jgi:hypothetical protein
VGDGNYNFINIAIFFFVLLSDTHQGRVWNQITQPELVAKSWQRRDVLLRWARSGVVHCACLLFHCFWFYLQATVPFSSIDLSFLFFAHAFRVLSLGNENDACSKLRIAITILPYANVHATVVKT